jgi:hypothetical protein
MTPKKTSEMDQMNLPFCDREPIILPLNKQQELGTALADLLLNVALDPSESESEERI